MTLNLKSSSHFGQSINVGSPSPDQGAYTDMDRAVIEKNLKTLRHAWDTPITQLQGEQKETFWQIVNKVRSVYTDKIDEYGKLYDTIREVFVADDRERDIQAGTVGAYFGGCLYNKDGCSSVCAGSVPPPSGHRFCESHVFSAHYNQDADEFQFRRVYNAPDIVTRAIIYVDANSIDEFPGFNETERMALGQNNIKSVSILQQRHANDAPRVIGVDGYVSLDQVKNRIGSARQVATNGYSGWAIFGLIVVIAIICLVIWMIVRESKSSKSFLADLQPK